MTKDPWVATLKAGDEVAVRDKCVENYQIMTVASVTPSGLVRVRVSDTYVREYNPDGWLRGADTWSHERIEPVTDRVRGVIRRCVLLERIGKTSWSKLTTETLENVAALLPEVRP